MSQVIGQVPITKLKLPTDVDFDGCRSKIRRLQCFTLGRVMRNLRNLIWALSLVGAVVLGWWFSYGWWRSDSDTMLDRDHFRFGPVASALSLVWLLLLVIAPLLSARHRRQKAREEERGSSHLAATETGRCG